MAKTNKVVWKEGLLVRPHHFQQESRYHEASLTNRINGIREFAFGLTDIQINSEYLSFGKIMLDVAKGVMPDGTAFNIPEQTATPEVLTVDNVSLVSQTVYLALPLKSDGQREVQQQGESTHTRLKAESTEVKDQHSPTGDYTQFDTAMPNFKLLLEKDDRSSFTTLAIAKIKDVRPDNSIELDESFYPTSLSINAIPPLKRFLGEVGGLMRERSKTLAERVGSPSQAGVADVTDYMMLLSLNRLHPYYLHLANMQHLHPECLYGEFVQTCGELITFTEDDKVPQKYPAYNHESPRLCFAPLEDTLRNSLSTVMQAQAVPIDINQQEFGLHTSPVPDRYLLQTADFIIAVKAQLPTEQLVPQFTQQTKMASLEKISELVNLQLPGIPLMPLPVAPRQLPYHAGFSYFKLDKNTPAWEMMKDTTGFGFHISGDFPELELQFWAIRG